MFKRIRMQYLSSKTFAMGKRLSVCLLLGCAGALGHAESTAFTPESALSFSGRITLDDLYSRLNLDYIAGRKSLAPLDIGPNAQVEYWTYGAEKDLAPRSLEIHLQDGPWVVVALADSRVLTYLRHGTYWVSAGRPEDSAPTTAKTRENAISEDKAKATAEEWMAKLAADGTWQVAEVNYKDRFDVVEKDLFGAWWEVSCERTHGGFPVRGANAYVGLDAETGALMRFDLPPFTPPRSVEVYFPPANARLQAQLYMESAPNPLMDLVQFETGAPEASIAALGDDFTARGAGFVGKDSRQAKKLAKRLEKEQRKAAEDAPDGEAAEVAKAIPPTLLASEPTLALVLVSEVYKQNQWQPIDATDPKPRYALAYEFATQTPTAPTRPVYVLAATDEVAR